MIFYFANILINLIAGAYFLKEGRFRNGKKIYLFVTGVQLTLIAGLRSTSVGIDTKSYERIFEEVRKYDIRELNSYPHAEFLYVLICKVIQLCGGNYQWALVITGAIIGFGLVKFIYDYSENPMLSVYLLISLGVYYFSFNGTRSALAMVFIINSLKYAMNKKFIKYTLCFIVAFFFHKSSIFYFPLYLVGYLKSGKKATQFILISLFLALALFNTALNIAIMLLPQYGIYRSTQYLQPNVGWQQLITYTAFALWACMVFFSKKNKAKRASKIHVTHLAFIMLTFAMFAMSFRMEIVSRLAVPFMAFATVSLPSILNLELSQTRKMWYTMGIIAYATIFHIVIINANWNEIVPYAGFWQ
ncbi:MAG: EpsG family protein [Firmicutes bacterium]|nr:EpsG family protein [Bacillota bacterium]